MMRPGTSRSLKRKRRHEGRVASACHDAGGGPAAGSDIAADVDFACVREFDPSQPSRRLHPIAVVARPGRPGGAQSRANRDYSKQSSEHEERHYRIVGAL